MKKILTAILLAVIALSVPTTTNARMRWAATAGVTVNDMTFKQTLVPVSHAVGYTAGITGENIFPGIGIGIEVGLLYNQQSAKIDLGSREVWSSLGYGNEHLMIHCIQIPVYLRWKWTRLNGLEDKIAPLIFGGPQFNIQAGHTNGSAFEFSHGDLGLTAGLGVELWKRWQVTGSYTWGMTYSMKTKLLDDFSAQSRQWTVKVAYFF